jgi:hypothetical protein
MNLYILTVSSEYILTTNSYFSLSNIIWKAMIFIVYYKIKMLYE